MKLNVKALETALDFCHTVLRFENSRSHIVLRKENKCSQFVLKSRNNRSQIVLKIENICSQKYSNRWLEEGFLKFYSKTVDRSITFGSFQR